VYGAEVGANTTSVRRSKLNRSTPNTTKEFTRLGLQANRGGVPGAGGDGGGGTGNTSGTGQNGTANTGGGGGGSQTGGYSSGGSGIIIIAFNV
jgi:hypothetical protein